VVPVLSLSRVIVAIWLHLSSIYIILNYVKTHLNTMEKPLFYVHIPHLYRLPTLSVVKHLMMWETRHYN
jgi:hypothetical protein